MQDLIESLKEKAGISDEQAEKVLSTIKQYVIDKFPMMAGAVENLLPGKAPGDSQPSKGSTGFGDILD